MIIVRLLRSTRSQSTPCSRDAEALRSGARRGKSPFILPPTRSAAQSLRVAATRGFCNGSSLDKIQSTDKLN